MLPLHFLPQVPQLFGSEPVFTHCPLQAELPEAQLTPHCPSLQVAVPPGTAGHLFPQAPQLFRSVRGSMQPAPQAMNGL
jgi:hypothetical protein